MRTSTTDGALSERDRLELGARTAVALEWASRGLDPVWIATSFATSAAGPYAAEDDRIRRRWGR